MKKIALIFSALFPLVQTAPSLGMQQTCLNKTVSFVNKPVVWVPAAGIAAFAILRLTKGYVRVCGLSTLAAIVVGKIAYSIGKTIALDVNLNKERVAKDEETIETGLTHNNHQRLDLEV